MKTNILLILVITICSTNVFPRNTFKVTIEGDGNKFECEETSFLSASNESNFSCFIEANEFYNIEIEVIDNSIKDYITISSQSFGPNQFFKYSTNQKVLFKSINQKFTEVISDLPNNNIIFNQTNAEGEIFVNHSINIEYVFKPQITGVNKSNYETCGKNLECTYRLDGLNLFMIDRNHTYEFDKYIVKYFLDNEGYYVVVRSKNDGELSFNLPIKKVDDHFDGEYLMSENAIVQEFFRPDKDPLIGRFVLIDFTKKTEFISFDVSDELILDFNVESDVDNIEDYVGKSYSITRAGETEIGTVKFEEVIGGNGFRTKLRLFTDISNITSTEDLYIKDNSDRLFTFTNRFRHIPVIEKVVLRTPSSTDSEILAIKKQSDGSLVFTGKNFGSLSFVSDPNVNFDCESTNNNQILNCNFTGAQTTNLRAGKYIGRFIYSDDPTKTFIGDEVHFNIEHQVKGKPFSEYITISTTCDSEDSFTAFRNGNLIDNYRYEDVCLQLNLGSIDEDTEKFGPQFINIEARLRDSNQRIVYEGRKNILVVPPSQEYAEFRRASSINSDLILHDSNFFRLEDFIEKQELSDYQEDVNSSIDIKISPLSNYYDNIPPQTIISKLRPTKEWVFEPLVNVTPTFVFSEYSKKSGGDQKRFRSPKLGVANISSLIKIRKFDSDDGREFFLKGNVGIIFVNPTGIEIDQDDGNESLDLSQDIMFTTYFTFEPPVRYRNTDGISNRINWKIGFGGAFSINTGRFLLVGIPGIDIQL